MDCRAHRKSLSGLIKMSMHNMCGIYQEKLQVDRDQCRRFRDASSNPKTVAASLAVQKRAQKAAKRLNFDVDAPNSSSSSSGE